MTDSCEAPALTAEDQADILLSIFCNFAEKGADDLFAYFRHVGFDPRVVREPHELPDAWLGYYRIKQGVYDLDRACNDYATWPPIAARIFELLREQRAGLAK